MKITQVVFKGLIAFSILAIVTVGCRKKEKEDKDTQSANDSEEMEASTNDVANMSDAAAAGISSFRIASGDEVVSTMSPCAVVTRDTLSTPRTIVIDFGTSNCLCQDNRYRRGKINISYTGSYFGVGSSRTATFTDYYINDKHLEGTHTVTSNGMNSAGNYTWTINAVNMKITRPDGRFHTWNSTRTREMIAGATTPLNRQDDVYLISGSATGVNINGVAFTATITDPLKKSGNCHWIESGKLEITPENRPTRVLDYGTSGCDNQATVTIGSNTYNITLN